MNLLAGAAVCGGAIYALGSYSKLDADWTTSKYAIDISYFENKKTIWITGSSSGIGKALVYYIASLNQNNNIIISSRRQNILNNIKHDIEINKRYKCNIFVLSMDCNNNSAEYYQNKYTEILNHFKIKYIDILINNAGFSMRSHCIDLIEKDHIDMIQTNLLTPILLTKLVLSDMDKYNGGHIVNISSVAARLTPACRTTYNATKSGMLSFGISLQDEMKDDNICITTILPGSVSTNENMVARGKNGSLFGKGDESMEKDAMSSKRCAQLICVAISNKLNESWPCTRPILDYLYCEYYAPFIYHKWFRKRISKMLQDAAGYDSLIKSKL